jgi:hypothetical protein
MLKLIFEKSEFLIDKLLFMASILMDLPQLLAPAGGLFS